MMMETSKQRSHARSSVTSVSGLHRKLLSMIIEDNSNQVQIFLNFQLEQSCTSIVAYVQKSHGHQQEIEGTLFSQFMAIVTAAAMIELYNDPDPPEIREMERQEKMEQLEIENDALFMSLEDTEWELDLLKKKYRQLKTRYHILKSDSAIQAGYVLELSKKYSDTQILLAKRDEEEIGEPTISDLEAARGTPHHRIFPSWDSSMIQMKLHWRQDSNTPQLTTTTYYDDCHDQESKSNKPQQEHLDMTSQISEHEQISDASAHSTISAQSSVTNTFSSPLSYPKKLRQSLGQYMATTETTTEKNCSNGKGGWSGGFSKFRKTAFRINGTRKLESNNPSPAMSADTFDNEDEGDGEQTSVTGNA